MTLGLEMEMEGMGDFYGVKKQIRVGFDGLILLGTYYFSKNKRA